MMEEMEKETKAAKKKGTGQYAEVTQGLAWYIVVITKDFEF